MRQLGFDLHAATAARDNGIALGESSAGVAWQEAALEAIRMCAVLNRELIVDDVWPYLSHEVTTKDLRAMGSMMLKAAREELIAPTERYQLSARVSSHRNPRRIWRSLLHEEREVSDRG